jgi:hypothetical protein
MLEPHFVRRLLGASLNGLELLSLNAIERNLLLNTIIECLPGSPGLPSAAVLWIKTLVASSTYGTKPATDVYVCARESRRLVKANIPARARQV